MNDITISAKILTSGFQTIVDQKKIVTHYPQKIWQSVPSRQKRAIAETASYFTTRHLPLSHKASLFYQFAPPAARLLYDYGLFYSMIEAPYEFLKKKLTTPTVLQSVYNTEFFVRFAHAPKTMAATIPFKAKKHTVVMPISFGKDSLLTFALSRELGFTIHPIFFEEPTCAYQNIKKRKLARQFEKEFAVPITRFPNALGRLRQAGSMMWGWDMLLLQYTTLLIPFIFRYTPQYFFWSNEQSTDEFAPTREGYLVNYTHEQSVQWVLHLTNLFRQFGIPTTIASIIEPVHELAILSILHKRYPEIGKYQLSCDGEKTSHRWCGRCFECARVYLFLTALGVDPKRVGIMDNMFDRRKRGLFYLFSEKRQDLNIVFQSYPERLLSFYLVYKRGIRGGLVDEFARNLLPLVEKQKRMLLTKYFSAHPSYTVPDPLKTRLYHIYTEELTRLKKVCNSL